MLPLLLLVELRVLLRFLDLLPHAQLAELLPQILYELFLPLILLGQPGLLRFVLLHLYLDIFVHPFKVVELAESLFILHQLLSHLPLLLNHATVFAFEPPYVLLALGLLPIELLKLDLEAAVVGLVVHEFFLKLQDEGVLLCCLPQDLLQKVLHCLEEGRPLIGV
jgi:hypothetical protein